MSAPTVIRAAVWQQVMFGLPDEPAAFASAVDAQRVLELTTRLNNQIVDELFRGDFVPLGYPDDRAVRDWCEGYIAGVRLDSAWVQDEHGAELTVPMGLLSGDLDPADLRDEHGKPAEDPSLFLKSAKESLPHLAVEIHGYFLEKRTAGAAAAARPAATPGRTKAGPNAPCPCGSGKKHKKCCGAVGG
ncbi:MAG: UPF0149 family protein [Deltaproteobacteria bacterium]|nr:UPF0149 family protein [Deltaproteobacteria bacterium]